MITVVGRDLAVGDVAGGAVGGDRHGRCRCCRISSIAPELGDGQDGAERVRVDGRARVGEAHADAVGARPRFGRARAWCAR